MADWSGLLNWSTKYHDGTEQTNFEPMSADDKKWLSEAMHEHAFNDADRLKEVCEELKKDIDGGFKQQNGTFDHILQLLEEC